MGQIETAIDNWASSVISFGSSLAGRAGHAALCTKLQELDGAAIAAAIVAAIGFQFLESAIAAAAAVVLAEVRSAVGC